ncbi:MAG: hypothetical protein ACR2HC_04335 [Thermoleophilaceae bacterium]
MQRFTRPQAHDYSPRFVRALLERPPAVGQIGWSDSAHAHFDGDAGLEWVPILDVDNTPLALAGRPLLPGGEPRLGGIDRLEPDITISAAARRAMDRPVAERLVPFLRCDSRGRYVAIVRVELVMAELADGYDRRDPALGDQRRDHSARL